MVPVRLRTFGIDRHLAEFCLNRGWVAGGGMEFMATANWLLRVEYLHYAFNSGSTVTAACTSASRTHSQAPETSLTVRSLRLTCAPA